MLRYKVLEKGFAKGRMYDPLGKRNILHSDEPIKPVPSWLEPMKEESAAAKKKRETATAKANLETAERLDNEKSDIEAVTFIEPVGGVAKELGIETL